MSLRKNGTTSVYVCTGKQATQALFPDCVRRSTRELTTRYTRADVSLQQPALTQEQQKQHTGFVQGYLHFLLKQKATAKESVRSLRESAHPTEANASNEFL
ncbi:MAG: hypothetical protein GY820_06535 [Gammaproteobacteria bacterium]|nr:hypothetical protein [Gammaproteobacteria bacterium]